MYVDVEAAIEVAWQPQSLRARAHVRHSGLRRLLHHITQLAGQRQLAFAVDDSSFRAKNRPAYFRPCQTRNQTDFATFMRQAVTELYYSQEIVYVFIGDRDVVVLAFLHHFSSYLAAHVADFPLQITHPSFPRVGTNQGPDGVVGEFDVLIRQPRLGHLLFHQELLRDLDLLRFGVTMQPQHFHAVLQSRGDGVHHIGGGDEKHLRKVVLHV